MPYPSPPEISTSYTAQEQALGDGTLPGQELDVDLASIRASITDVINFVRGITRSDGALANGVVTQEALGAALIIGFDPPSVWATATDYTTRSIVFEGTKIYLCLVEHTSSVFATDLASARWSELADLTPTGGALIATNNLSDLTDVGNARGNLGLGSMATAVSGTGAAQHRTNLQNEAFFQPLAAGLTSWAAIARAAGFDTFAATPSSANLRALLTDETGSGALLFAGGAMGTPSSLDLTNATGLTTSGIAAAALTTAVDTIAANNVDTQVPTSAAVKAYVDKAGDTWTLVAFHNEATTPAATDVSYDTVDGKDYQIHMKGWSRTDGAGQPLTIRYFNGFSNDDETVTLPMGVAASEYTARIDVPNARRYDLVKAFDYAIGVVTTTAALVVAKQTVLFRGSPGGPTPPNEDFIRISRISIPLANVASGYVAIYERNCT